MGDFLMTLSQITSWINQATKGRLTETQIVLLIDAVQKMAFEEDLLAFKIWNQEVTLYQEITFIEAGYTSAIAGDIGSNVVGGSSGAGGPLISYNNTTRVWVVDTDDDFTLSEPVSIDSGTGAGTLAATSFQAGYKGPYSPPASPPCRKIHGITVLTDTKIFGTEVEIVPQVTTDYGILPDGFDPGRFFRPHRLNEVDNTLTFINAPDKDTVHRWVYWRTSEDITDAAADDALLLIPSAYHLNLIQACIMAANITISQEAFTKKDVDTYFKPWWDSLHDQFTPMGAQTNRTQGAARKKGVLF
jgi:hypothetical protein